MLKRLQRDWPLLTVLVVAWIIALAVVPVHGQVVPKATWQVPTTEQSIQSGAAVGAISFEAASVKAAVTVEVYGATAKSRLIIAGVDYGTPDKYSNGLGVWLFIGSELGTIADSAGLQSTVAMTVTDWDSSGSGLWIEGRESFPSPCPPDCL